MDKEFVSGKHIRICSAHFTCGDFEPPQGNKKRRVLKADAIPTIFPNKPIQGFPDDQSSDVEPNTSGNENETTPVRMY